MMMVRRAEPADIPAIVILVRSAVIETYRYLVDKHGPPAPGDPWCWTDSYVAIVGGKIVGVGLAQGDFISDLWVAKENRNGKIGSALLSTLEKQIEDEGHSHARLRVVADNARARTFYSTHGWREVRTYAHERDGHLMVDLKKVL